MGTACLFAVPVVTEAAESTGPASEAAHRWLAAAHDIAGRLGPVQAAWAAHHKKHGSDKIHVWIKTFRRVLRDCTGILAASATYLVKLADQHFWAIAYTCERLAARRISQAGERGNPDLLHHVMAQLHEAAVRYDASTGNKFVSLAGFYVRKAVNYGGARHGVVQPPTQARWAAVQARRRIQAGECPQAVAVDLGLSVDVLQSAIRALDAANAEEADETTQGLGNPWTDVDARILDDQQHALLAAEMLHLPARQRKALVLRYGLGDQEPLTHAKACEQLDIGVTTYRLTLRRALKTLGPRIRWRLRAAAIREAYPDSFEKRDRVWLRHQINALEDNKLPHHHGRECRELVRLVGWESPREPGRTPGVLLPLRTIFRKRSSDAQVAEG